MMSFEDCECAIDSANKKLHARRRNEECKKTRRGGFNICILRVSEKDRKRQFGDVLVNSKFSEGNKEIASLIRSLQMRLCGMARNWVESI